MCAQALKYCLIGHPIAHSFSAKFHNAAFRKIKFQCRYEAVDVPPANLRNFMKTFRGRYAGANVTIPHKQRIIKFLDLLSSEARQIGAVNTIVNKNGILKGFNTDLHGAMYALKEVGKLQLKKKRVIVLGAGGAARALVYGLTCAGAKVTILNRTLSHAKKLARDFKCAYGSLEDFNNSLFDILINTTSIGMKANPFSLVETPLPQFYSVILRQDQHNRQKIIVMDIVYTPPMTKLLRDAKKAGCRIITGDHMLRAQAAKAFELWSKSL